jgi:hypothetical protein
MCDCNGDRVLALTKLAGTVLKTYGNGKVERLGYAR